MSAFRYQKPAVLARLPAGHAVIEASAGTGKTYTLEHLVVELLLQGVPIGKVLVVTFTDKAALELRTRVRALIEKLLAADPEDRAPAGAADEACWRIDEGARRLLEAALREYDSASISTIHAFCQRVLTENAFANRRLFEEELADGRELFAQAFRDVLRRELAVDEEHREFLALWREDATVEGLEELLWSCAQRRGRIVPEFERGAVDANVTRFGRRADVLRHVPGFHAITRERMQASLEAIYDAVESFRAEETTLGAWRKLRGVFAETGTGGKPRAIDYASERLAKESAKKPELAPLAEAFAALEASLPTPQVLVAARFLPRVQARLAELKRSQGRYDFQDMLSLVDEALTGERGGGLLATLRARYSHALIDEFQDTDEVQWRVFRRVFYASKEHRLILVGDPKQAIYAFRGADVHTYLGAKREIGGEPAVLDENFRSTEGLIEAYNRLLADGFFTGDIAYDHPVTCGRKALAFDDPEPRAPIHVFVTGTLSSGKSKVYQRLGPAIAAEIRRLLDPERPARWKGERLRHRDVFVLARSGSDLEHVAAHLRAAGVPFAFYKQEGLFQSREAQAIEDVLAAVADPSSRARRCRAWLTPFFGLGLADVARAADLAADDALVARLQEWHRLAARRQHEKLFTSLLEDSGLVRRLVLLEPGERSLTNYLHVLEVLREQYVVRGASVEEMVQGLRAFRQGTRRPPGQSGNQQRLETDRDAVQLLTMHMSKGLEAPVVFVVGGLNRPPPGGVRTLHGAAADGSRERLSLVGNGPRALAAQADAEESEEDQRLLYVALTRAKGRLYLTYAGRRATGPDGRPVFEPAKKLTGAWTLVNERLEAILPDLKAIPGPGDRFSYQLLSAPVALPAAAEAEEAPAVPEPPAPPRALDLEAMRRRHAGFLTTSFSSLRDRMEGPAADAKADAHDAAAPAEDELPGGAATGSFLHEVLARIPPGAARESPTPEALAARPEVERLVGFWARRWGVAPQHLPHAHRLLHTALTSTLALGPAGRLPGIARADRLLREMDFLYPIPEAAHARLSQLPAGRFEIRRGFVVGFVDVLFEHQGRTYLADWKSNCLPAFDAQHVEDEVRRSYALQGELYTLALVKMLGVHDEAAYEARFGGLMFLFLRGLRADGEGRAGVWFRRPTWREVLGWEEKLVALDLSQGGAA